MKKMYALFFTLCTSPLLSMYALTRLRTKTPQKMYTIHSNPNYRLEEDAKTGICFSTNAFGDIFPLWEKINPKLLDKRLSFFIEDIKVNNKGTPCIVEVPHEKAPLIVGTLKKNGLTVRHADNNKTEWILTNDSSIPNPYNTSMGAQVIIKKYNLVLVIEEKTRKGWLEFPGGTSEFGEFPHETAARELEEETGLRIKPEDLELCAITNRKNMNRYGANGVDYTYVIDYHKVYGELKPDSKEIVQAFYAPLAAIALSSRVGEDLRISAGVAALAKHIWDGRKSNYRHTCIDYRQSPKNEADQDLNEVMVIEFFAE